MTDKQTYWLSGPDGKKALVTGSAERDRLAPLGWSDTSEATGDEFLYGWRYGIEQPGVFPAAAFRDIWEPRGWVTGPPPGSPSPFGADPAPTPVAPVPTAKPTKSTAAGGSTEEK
jgi:hypothetical protein